MDRTEIVEALSKLSVDDAREVVALADVVRVLRERMGLPIDMTILQEVAKLAAVVLRPE